MIRANAVDTLLVGAGFGGIVGLVTVAIFAVKLFALVDAAVRPARFWAAAGENRTLWLVILGLTAFFGLFGLITIFGLAGDVAVIVYFVDRRPKIREIQRGDNRW